MRWAAAALAGALLVQAPIERRAPKTEQPQAPQGVGEEQIPTIRVETRLVNIAVNVVDEKGAPVPGLGPRRF